MSPFIYTHATTQNMSGRCSFSFFFFVLFYVIKVVYCRDVSKNDFMPYNQLAKNN